MNWKTFFTGKVLLYIVLGFLVGIVLGVIIWAPADLPQKKAPGLSVVSGEEENVKFSEAVESVDQVAANTALVPYVRISTTSWVAIRENNGDLMGRILGAQKLEEGVHDNVVVDLLRPMSPHTMYAVVLYADNGDGVFDHRVDTLVLHNGEPVTASFVAQ